jgi:hypothetical protein
MKPIPVKRLRKLMLLIKDFALMDINIIGIRNLSGFIAATFVVLVSIRNT